MLQGIKPHPLGTHLGETCIWTGPSRRPWSLQSQRNNFEKFEDKIRMFIMLSPCISELGPSSPHQSFSFIARAWVVKLLVLISEGSFLIVIRIPALTGCKNCSFLLDVEWPVIPIFSCVQPHITFSAVQCKGL